jgi:DNA (cytosine-5)-methyltransferase 1
MADLVLSLFPGIGLLDMAFEQEGFCVVRGPDLLWGGDIRRFHPPAGRFDGVIGGPPCQAFSPLRHIVEHQGYAVAANLIPEFERVVGAARPNWFVMENVPRAPEPEVAGYIVKSVLWNNRWNGASQNRIRRLSFGTPHGVPLHPEFAALDAIDWEPTVCARGATPKIGGSGKIKRRYTTRRAAPALHDILRLQGLPETFLADAPFTAAGKAQALGNGVPLPMGRAVAQAVRKAIHA